VALTFMAVCVAWVFFRATSFAAALSMLRALFVPRAGLETPLPTQGFWITVGLVAIGHVLAQRGLAARGARRLPGPVLGLGYALALTLALVLAPDSARPFVYFQF
jgi:alginate O-acetyltransferase complex protein AlgI